MELHDLRPNEGSQKKRKRVGRGTKGQNARSGGGKGIYFEGGQLPLARRLPYKRGFTNRGKVYYKPVNIGVFTELEVESGTEITPELMEAFGLLKKSTDPVVILGDGEISVAVTVKAHRFSKSAKEKIEAAGGKVEVLPLV